PRKIPRTMPRYRVTASTSSPPTNREKAVLNPRSTSAQTRVEGAPPGCGDYLHRDDLFRGGIARNTRLFGSLSGHRASRGAESHNRTETAQGAIQGVLSRRVTRPSVSTRATLCHP